MAGKFEVFLDSDSRFRFRLKAPDGTVMAVSGAFEDKAAVAAGIAAVRECAGTGLVTDLCPAAKVAPPAPVVATAQLQPTCGDQGVPAPRVHTFVTAKTPRRRVTAPRWT
ncbi:MAG TPA: hypothetical protein DIT15_10475 [Arthrobacter bacterium]|jgi:uncharacterized protein YegP (UPF0339 family)|nr:hypothetical protein [Arthrobacter sp.]HBH57189.1 hypothetical protein [Arthrobacter sp.]HCB58355.1 hypothetical protein [Arthrobacter sp.]HCC40270.1 hypothetical protein [Arthrobacter sp.]HCN22650.1 hypothetical protein [Arthrobacter sp.]